MLTKTEKIATLPSGDTEIRDVMAIMRSMDSPLKSRVKGSGAESQVRGFGVDSDLEKRLLALEQDMAKKSLEIC